MLTSADYCGHLSDGALVERPVIHTKAVSAILLMYHNNGRGTTAVALCGQAALEAVEDLLVCVLLLFFS